MPLLPFVHTFCIRGKQGLGEACKDAGLNDEMTKSLLLRANGDDVKQRLQDVTDDAIKR